LVPSPAAPLGDGDSAARYPYPSVLPGEEYDMKTNWIKPFIYSAGGILLAAALIGFLIAAGHHPALALPEPLLGVLLRGALLAVGTLELVVAGICLFGKNARLQAAWLAWVGTNFVVFQIGLVWMRVHPQGTCLGSLTDPLHLARGFTGDIMAFLPFYVLLGSYMVVVAPWLAKHKVGQASRLSEVSPASCLASAPAYARFLKISCTACGGHIEFPTNLFGGQIPCPHCQSIITLQKAVTVKMACPACGGHLEFPDHAQGQTISCPHCQAKITLTKN
jgi:DNA-directed RNA polymerase subunit RPC12/RpoP